MAEGIRIGGGGKKEGLYVWAKYTKNPNLKANINFSNPTYSYPDTWTFDISSSDEQFDVSDLTEADFVSKVLKGNSNDAYVQVTFNANNTTTIWKSVYSRNYSGTYSYDNVSHKLAITNVESAYNVSWVYPTIEISVGGVFVDFVVNDSLNAYPNGGYHKDGYYYALVPLDPAKFGCSKIAVDKFTLSSLTNIYNGYAVNHSLGIVPKIIFLCTNEPITYGYRCLRRYVQFPTSNYLAYAVVTNNNAGGDYAGGGTGGTAPTASQVTIYEQLTSNEYLQAGIEYTLITMG